MQKKYKETQEFIEDHMLGPFTQSYMPLGDLKLDFHDIDSKEVTEYKRELNLGNATATTEFVHKSIQFRRGLYFPSRSVYGY